MFGGEPAWTIFLQRFTPVQAAMYNKTVRRCSEQVQLEDARNPKGAPHGYEVWQFH
jgi:hypothetical protein